jgi:hypothetical protein
MLTSDIRGGAGELIERAPAGMAYTGMGVQGLGQIHQDELRGDSGLCADHRSGSRACIERRAGGGLLAVAKRDPPARAFSDLTKCHLTAPISARTGRRGET